MSAHDGTPTVHDRAAPPLPGAGELRALSRRYQIVAPIASGGMAAVHLGRKVERDGSHRTVAIKVMHPYLAGDPEMVAMFLDEARVSRNITHPNVVPVMDVDMMGDDLVIVMDYVPGVSLLSLVRALAKQGKRLPVPVVVRIVLDVLAGLHAAHELRDADGRPLSIVHRDVSPHNVLVATDGVARVMDFGVAMAAGRLAQTQADGTVKGKLRYLSPEQLHRKPIDRRADVFAAGIVLWECLTGETLFGTGTEAETLGRVLRAAIAPPSSIAMDVPLAIDEVCLRALERDRDRRYASAKELASALEGAAPAVASSEEVGALVAAAAGAEIERHARALRENPPARTPAVARGADTASGVVRDAPRDGRGARTLLVAAISLVLGGAVVWGLGAFRGATPPAPAAAGTVQGTAPTASASESAAASAASARSTPSSGPLSASFEVIDAPAPADHRPGATKRALDAGARGAGRRVQRDGAPFMPSDL
jgi:serine/threonine-protein kinase